MAVDKIKPIRFYDSLEEMLSLMDRCSFSDRFKGDSLNELKDWQRSSRELLSELIGVGKLMEDAKARGVDRAKASFTEESVEMLEDGITRRKLILKTDEHTFIPMYVLEPGGVPKGTFLCPAGHQGGGKLSVAGVTDDPLVREKEEFFNYSYGLKLAWMGYVTICPDPRGFGERRDKAVQNADILQCSCRQLSNMAISLGLSVTGLNVWDLMRIIDWVTQEGRYPVDNLGCIGFSGGGLATLYLAALDERVKMAFISGYMYGFKDALLILNNNCSCNYVPHLYEHFDMGDIACMIAPRPLFIQSCKDDHLNGYRGLANVYEQVEIIKGAYSLYGCSDRLIHDIRPGGHHFHDEPIGGAIEQFMKVTGI